MNYTQKQTVVTTEYQKALFLLRDIAVEKVSQAIKEIVRANGGIIDLTPNPDEDQDDMFQHAFSLVILVMTSTGRTALSSEEYPVVFYLDLEGIKMMNKWDDVEECEIIHYDDMDLNYLLEILNELMDYH